MSSSSSSPTAHILAHLARTPTCVLSDALLTLDPPAESGGPLPDILPLSPTRDPKDDERVVGEAYTVQMVDAKDKDAPKPSEHFVDTAPEGSVMVISAPEGAKNAVLGGLLGIAAKARGVRGVVVSGRVRDLGELREAKLPVFAHGQSTLGQSPFTRPSLLSHPLTIHPLPPSNVPPTCVEPGDYVVADLDGVVVVPRARAEEVLKIARKAEEVDGRVEEDLRAGKGVKETFGKWRGK